MGWRITKVVLKISWIAAMILTPLFGFWLASSLAAYKNASQWLALSIGLLLFPILPMGWDWVSEWRRRRRERLEKRLPRKRIMTRLDRLVLRTLAINGVFLGIMLSQAPRVSFRALAVRGDWILDGHDGPTASWIRDRILGFADHFDQRWHQDDDQYGESDEVPDDVKEGQPFAGWPVAQTVDPAVKDMPESAQMTIESAGAYLAARIPDPKMRLKAVHDYVALRVTYDKAALTSSVRPSQLAEDVFRTKLGVCEGYARLMVALGKAAGLEVAYVTGVIRDAQRDVDPMATDDAVRATLEGYGHAWNAAKIDGLWYLVDATWDDQGETPETTYFMTPPKLFRYDHLPDEPAWQLVSVPLSVGEFARQPLMSPASGSLGVVLEAPTRSQITVTDGEAELLLDNPYGMHLAGVAQRSGDHNGEPNCKVETTEGTHVAVRCELGRGEYKITLWGGKQRTGMTYVGTILVNSR